MPDLQYDGTLRIASNDPVTPREIALRAVQSTFFVPVSFVSYEGFATIHGITELADVTDPPKKYQNMIPNEGSFLREQEVGGPAALSPIDIILRNRTSVNDSDVKYQQIQIQEYLGNKGARYTFPPYTDIPIGTPWWMGSEGGGGGFGSDSIETLPAPGLVAYGWDEAVPNWYDLPFTKDKRSRTLQAMGGFTRDVVEEPTSPVMVFRSREHGSTTDPNARFAIRITAERGTANPTYNIYVVWSMGQYAVGTGPLATVYIQARRGNQILTCDETGNRLGSFQAGPGAGVIYKYRRFGLPFDCSFRLFGVVAGFPTKEYQFPQDWASEEARITDDALIEIGHSPWFYLPAAGAVGVPDSSLLRLQTYKEVLVNEDPLPDALIAEGGTVVATNEWARTVAVSGGVDPESHDPIEFDGETIRASFTMPDLTPLQVYTVKLTYEQRLIGTADSVLIEDSIDVYPGLATFADVEFDIIAPVGYERRLYATSQLGSAPQPEEGDGVNRISELLWEAEAIDNGATYTEAETTAIGNFLTALDSKPYKNNLKYVLPFFGNDLATQLLPCWDFDFRGPATNNNFVDGDCSTAIGLDSDGSSKWLEMPFSHYDLQTQQDRSGMGLYLRELNWGGDSGSWMSGIWNAPPNQVYGLSVSGKSANWYHGVFGSQATISIKGEHANYYGVSKSNTDHKIYIDGVLKDASVVNSLATDANYDDIRLFGDNISGGDRYSPTKIHCAYFTDGSAIWTDANILDLHNLIKTHLIEAVGRSFSADTPDLASFKTRVTRASGTLTANSLTYAKDLIDDIRAWDGYLKIRYVPALLGDNVATAMVPLMDSDQRGDMTNSGFLDGDFDEAVGLVGAGAVPGARIIFIPYTPNELGSGGNGGMGFRDVGIFPANANSWQPMGMQRTSNQYSLMMKQTVAFIRGFRWGLDTNGAEDATQAVEGHYYGQSDASNDREAFLDGVSFATETTADARTGINDGDIALLGVRNYSTSVNNFWCGTCGIAYLTTGDLTPTEITNLHTIIEAFITATGR